MTRIRRFALPQITPSRRRALIGLGMLVAVGTWATIVALAEPYDWSQIGPGHDARPYWTADFDRPYTTSAVGAHNAYLYSPAFLQVIAPIRALPWQAFMGAWTAVLLIAAVYLAGPVLVGAVVILALPELFGGNVTLLIGVAIVLGFRWPATWAFVLLTKLTPGLGLVWFLVRREWRNLVVALGATVAIVAASWLVAAPGAWNAWFDVLTTNVNQPIESGSLPVPLLVRLPVALVVIAWGAAGNRRWVLPIGCLLALPVIWYGSLSLLAAILPLIRVPGLHEWRRRGLGATAPAAPAGR